MISTFSAGFGLHLSPPGTRARFRQAVVPLVLLDLAVVAVHGMATVLFNADLLHKGRIQRFLQLSFDHSAGEMFMYLKWSLASALMAYAGLRCRGRLFAAFSLTFLILLADDAGQLHETFGKTLSHRFAFSDMFGLRGQDLGELSIWAALGLVIVLSIGLGLRRRLAAERLLAPYLLGTLALLILCGIGVDMLHVAIIRETAPDVLPALADFALTMAEDGGELVLSSAMVGYAWIAAGYGGQGG